MDTDICKTENLFGSIECEVGKIGFTESKGSQIMKRYFLLLSGCIFLQGCANFWGDENPAHYTRDKAAGAAMEKLVRYADLHHVPVYQFRGPYFMESLGGDFPTYVVCYKHPIHFFCYDDWTGNEDSGPYVAGEEETERMKWLKSQPD